MVFIPNGDPCDDSPFVCLEHDINRQTWQKLLLKRGVFGACCGVGFSMLGDPNQERQWMGCIRGASGWWDARFGHHSRAKAVKHDLVSGILLSGLVKRLDGNGTRQSTDFHCALVGSGHTKVTFYGPKQSCELWQQFMMTLRCKEVYAVWAVLARGSLA